MTRSARIVLPLAVALLTTVGTRAALAENFMEKQFDKMKFEEWALKHPEWVSSHHDRYEFFMHHPEEADKFRSEWADWHAGAGNIQFAEWAAQHPDWVTSHHERYEYFLHHPQEADVNRAEWYEWNAAAANAAAANAAAANAAAANLQFEQWAAAHNEWVTTHHDRYEYFLHHPQEAEQYRSEWYGWHPGGTSVQFSEWAASHPEWVREHHERYEHFIAHPNEAEEFRHEWYHD